MSLPVPSMSFSPFAILTAEEMNDLVENIEALADGSGLDNGAVEPAKRSGGFKVGVFTLNGTTGNQSITGLGFRPKFVEFNSNFAGSTGGSGLSIGAMDENGNQNATAIATAVAANQNSVNSSTTRCFITVPSGSSTPNREAAYVSMDADGFTINVITAVATTPVCYKAYG